MLQVDLLGQKLSQNSNCKRHSHFRMLSLYDDYLPSCNIIHNKYKTADGVMKGGFLN